MYAEQLQPGFSVILDPIEEATEYAGSFFRKDVNAFGLDQSGQFLGILLIVVGAIMALVGLLVFSEVRAAINVSNVPAGALSVIDVIPILLAVAGLIFVLLGIVSLTGMGRGR